MAVGSVFGFQRPYRAVSQRSSLLTAPYRSLAFVETPYPGLFGVDGFRNRLIPQKMESGTIGIDGFRAIQGIVLYFVPLFGCTLVCNFVVFWPYFWQTWSV